MQWPYVLLVAAGCRIGFDEAAPTVLDAALHDGAPDMAIDAAPGTRIVTFGERSTSMVQNVTTDTCVVEGANSLNFGATTGTSVYGTIERGLVRFDLSSLTTADIVLEAVLQLGVEGTGDQVAGLFQVIELEESWVEGAGDGEIVAGVTWMSRDGTTLWSTPGGTGTLNLAVEMVGAITGPLDLPLLANEVQNWIDDPTTNHGVVLLSADGGHWHLATRENASDTLRPQLRLVLQDP